MWIIGKHGFLSVVKNTAATSPSDALLVRARVHEDLEHFAKLCHTGTTKIVRLVESDYEFRLATSRSAVGSYLGEQVRTLDYANFKDHVAKSDPYRAHIYASVWRALAELEGIAAKRASWVRAFNAFKRALGKSEAMNEAAQVPR